jgi:hypothetical protein
MGIPGGCVYFTCLGGRLFADVSMNTPIAPSEYLRALRFSSREALRQLGCLSAGLGIIGRGEFHSLRCAEQTAFQHRTRSYLGYQAQSCTYLAPRDVVKTLLFLGAPPARGILRDSATFSSDSFDDTFRRKPHITPFTSPAPYTPGQHLHCCPQGVHSDTRC